MLQSHYGTDLPAQNVILINKLFEKNFEKDLSHYCILKSGTIKNRIEEFCNFHNIEVGNEDTDHISFEALIKKEYRLRKNRQNVYCKIVR